MIAEIAPHSTTPMNGSAGAADTPRVLDHLRTYVTIVTPERAREILATQNWERQRPLRAKHIEYLASAIERGELTDLALIFAELPNGARRLVDGQHRLHALAESGRTLPAAVTVHRVNDDDDTGRLYLKIDRQTSRLPVDGLRAFGIEQSSGLASQTLSRIGSAIPLLETGFSRTASVWAKSLIARTEATRRWLPAGAAYAGCLEGATGEVSLLLWRRPVAAVGIATAHYQPGFAEQFWRPVAREDGLKVGDSRRTLLSWLRNNRVTTRSTPVLYARHVANAWNAFFEGRSLERLSIKDPSAPVRIAGTPFGHGGR